MTKILLVEDDKSLREIYGVRLLAEGYDIVSAGDGEEALAMAIKDRPDLIVSDVMMPKISGFDMLDILRSTTETRNIKVIMMTALSSEDQRQRGVALGADRYLVKSQVGIEDVVRTVHEVLGDTPGGPSPAPTALPTQQAPAVEPIPTPQPVATTPAVAAPTLAPTPQPVTPPAPDNAPPTHMPTFPWSPPSSINTAPLPQPTAPFSTTRPASLGDRVIHPLESSEPPQDFGNLMEKELTDHAAQMAAPAPAPVMSPPSVPPSPITPPTEPTPPPTPAASTDMNFEETPLVNSPGTPPPAPIAPIPPTQSV